MFATSFISVRNIFFKLIIYHISKMSAKSKQPSAGILIIGDEILKGQTQDTNSFFISQRLYKLGVKLKHISVIPDDLIAISKEVKDFSANYDYVITSGGIGPTHDDKTFEGVAHAFDDKLTQNQEILDIINAFLKQKNSTTKESVIKMSFIPSMASLIYAVDVNSRKKLKYPLVVVKNVYIFPGIPSLLEKTFLGLEHVFKNKNMQLYLKELYFLSDELSITEILTEADKLFGGKVIIGSYPETTNPYYKVKVTLESTEDQYLTDICDFFNAKIPAKSFINFDTHPIMNAAEKVYNLATMDTNLGRDVTKSLQIIEEALHRYNVNEIIVGFNGGKDCTALIHLVYAVLLKSTPPPSPDPSTNGLNNNQPPWLIHNRDIFNVLFIRKGRSFPEMELFVKQTINRYSIKSVEIEGPIKEGLVQLKRQRPDIKAVFMGTRCSDPSGINLSEFQMTDPGWPEFMRINPILHWSYTTVWSFIRNLSLPYCPLYDVGYTSIGCLENTHPNPALRTLDDRGTVSFAPAYTLADESLERNGRN